MEIFSDRCPWYLGGLLLAFVAIALQWYGNLSLGVTGTFGATKHWLARRFQNATWQVLFFFGAIGGALIHSLLTGGFHPTFAYGSFDELAGGLPGSSLPAKAMILFVAGILVGFGSRNAGGCTSGHGICGMSRNSGASLLTTMIFMAVAVATAWLIRLLLGGAR